MPDDDKVDLLLSHPGVNYDYACAHSLISINGLFHYFTKSDNGWLIKDGNTTKRKSKDKNTNGCDRLLLKLVVCL